MTPLHLPFRWHAGILTALAGGAMAQSMVMWGGSLSHFLPHAMILGIVAFCGAGLAGLVHAGALGRDGRQGWVIMLFVWPFTTALGSVLAVLPLAVMDAGAGLEPMLRGAIAAAGLGLLAVTDGILTSTPVACVWASSGVLLHRALRVQRAAVT